MYLLIATPDNNGFAIAIGKENADKIVFVKKKFQQAELLLSEIDNLVGAKKIEGIMVVTGPGAFSALRIGIATANAMSYGLKKPIVGLRIDPAVTIDESYVGKFWLDGAKKLKKKTVWKMSCLVTPFYDKEPSITKAKSKI